MWADRIKMILKEGSPDDAFTFSAWPRRIYRQAAAAVIMPFMCCYRTIGIDKIVIDKVKGKIAAGLSMARESLKRLVGKGWKAAAQENQGGDGGSGKGGGFGQTFGSGSHDKAQPLLYVFCVAAETGNIGNGAAGMGGGGLNEQVAILPFLGVIHRFCQEAVAGQFA